MPFRNLLGCVLAFLILITAVPAWASVAPSGWRAATEEEKSLRKAFEDAQGSWSRKQDGEGALYECMIRWAAWSAIMRDVGDEIRTISGELTHSYADGQLSHYLSTLSGQSGNVETFSQKVSTAAMSFSGRPDESLKVMLQKLGKCYVVPTSWAIRAESAMTGPQFMKGVFNESYPEEFPEFVRSAKDRRAYDRLILQKDFVGAANLGAALHGTPDKTTVMWNEVLAASKFAVGQGRGTELSDALLTTLSKVWWPKSNRSVAEGLLMKKHGRTVARKEAPKQPDIPYWAQQEYERYIGGRTNYTPCNQWYKAGC